MGGVLENGIKNLQSDIRVFKAYPFYSQDRISPYNIKHTSDENIEKCQLGNY